MSSAETFSAIKATAFIGVKASTWSKKWFSSRAFSGLMPACTVVGGITGCYQLYLWVDEHRKQEKEAKRKKHAAKLNAKLKEEKNREVLLAAARAKVSYPDVNWETLYKRLSNSTVQEVNKLIRKKNIDYVGEHEVAEIVEELRGDAKKEMLKELTNHALATLKPEVLKAIDAWKAIPGFDTWVNEMVHQRAEGHATEQLSMLGDTVVDTITEIAVHDARERHYARISTDLDGKSKLEKELKKHGK